ncbi:MAG: SGNH/GDSL hydrolase family protein, partial [Myxococcales bacterium]|nr:SGNH/GDSL hydrolase family protein [Myxococcales bacterium]
MDTLGVFRVLVSLTLASAVAGCTSDDVGVRRLLPAADARDDVGFVDADAPNVDAGFIDAQVVPDSSTPDATDTPELPAPDDIWVPEELPAPDDVEDPDDMPPTDDVASPDDADLPGDTGPVDVPPPPDVSYPALYPPDKVHSPLTPSVVARLAAIHATDPALADDVFMKIGASTTVSNSYLGCFAGENVALESYAGLQPTLDFFLGGDAAGSDPFSRKTVAAKVGVSAGWAITGDPSPLEQEYLALSPSFAFVHYGTNDLGMGSTYESALFNFGDKLWTLTDELLGWGVIPILVTIGQRLDDPAADAWVDTFNGAIAAVAQGRQVPLLDANLAYEPIPNYGIASDGIHSSVYPGGACQLTDPGLDYGMNIRNAHSLVVLDRLRRAVLLGEALDPPGAPLLGAGTHADPIVVPSLPFSDLRSTIGGEAVFDAYPGCNAAQNESGPEVVYRLELTAETSLRATVHDLGTVDVDLHVLDDTGTPDGCLKRAHRFIDVTLPAGVYYVVLDSFVSG